MLHPRRWFQYRLERALLRGVHMRLLAMAGLVGIVSLIGGAALRQSGEATEPFWDTVWWAFLRLTDPGYLGDDDGLWKRVISTILTVLGYVIFMGSLVAIMTQWLHARIRDLELGLTPVAMKNHLLVLGWTSRTRTIVRELLESEGRARQFLLELRRARGLSIVLLVEELSAELRESLRAGLGPLWRESQIIMRSGSPLLLDHLRRVDFARSAAILLPVDDLGATEDRADANTIKTLLSIEHHTKSEPIARRPLVVAELFDASRLGTARRAYSGPIEVVATDRLIARILALSVVYPGCSGIFEELLARGAGSEFYVVDPGTAAGRPFAEARRTVASGIVLGVVRRRGDSFRALLSPAADEVVKPDDGLVLIAEAPELAIADQPAKKPPAVHASKPVPRIGDRDLSVLVLGWSDRVPDLIAELAGHLTGQLSVTVLSARAIEDRTGLLGDHDLRGARVNNVVADLTAAPVVRRAVSGAFDRIVLVASDWLDTSAESDARTLLTYLLCRDAARKQGTHTPLVVELMGANNRPLIDTAEADVVVSPLTIGRVLAQVTLRRELRAVYDELLSATGARISLRAPHRYGIEEPATFSAMFDRAAAVGDTLLGWIDGDGEIVVNPDRNTRLDEPDGARLVLVVGRS